MSVSRPFPAWLSHLVFGLALAIHAFLVTRHWHEPALLGHEFRQAQTAVIARTIDEQNNFSLDYETPILGKPWAIPLEVPVYQWCVVLLQRALNCSDVAAARTVSLACFYLTLVALWPLLRALGLQPGERRWLLAFVLCCPVYLFYARAFLIDPMATLASVAFLAAFERTMTTRRWPWAVVCAVAGSLGALIKSLVFFVWLAPAAIWGAWLVWGHLRRRDGLRPLLQTCLWGVAPTLPVAWLLHAWIARTDAIKAEHPSGWIFTSSALSSGNFGTFSLESRLSAATWMELFARWREALAGPGWIFALLALGLLASGRFRPHLLLAAGCFLVGQLAFPYAYAYQDYYFYAAGIFLAAALGFAALGWLEHPRWPRALRLVLALLPGFVLLAAYFTGYHRTLRIDNSRDWAVTRALRELLPPDHVIIVAGNDWSAVLPYFAHKRALMIRHGLEHDFDYLVRAFDDLDDEPVGALVLVESQRGHDRLRDFATRRFALDPQPTFRSATVDVYAVRSHREAMVQTMRASPDRFFDVWIDESRPESGLPAPPTAAKTVSAAHSAERYPLFGGHVVAIESEHELSTVNDPAGPYMNVHPDARIVVTPPATVGRVGWRFGVLPGAYTGRAPGDQTDGVVFLLRARDSNGALRTLYRRHLQPATRESDRDVQAAWIDYHLHPGEVLVFELKGGITHHCDWATINGVEWQPPASD